MWEGDVKKLRACQTIIINPWCDMWSFIQKRNYLMCEGRCKLVYRWLQRTYLNQIMSWLSCSGAIYKKFCNSSRLLKDSRIIMIQRIGTRKIQMEICPGTRCFPPIHHFVFFTNSYILSIERFGLLRDAVWYWGA